MEREWLAKGLAEGRSIETLAREAGKSPSTVAYWVNKHGLASTHAAKHATRGSVSRDRLAELVAEGLTIQEIAERLGIGATATRHWLRKHGLRTSRARHAPQTGGPAEMRRCRTHGFTLFVRTGSAGGYRCRLCRSEHVTRSRRRLKAILIAEAGGCCAVCGYDRFAGALHFHHVDPAQKSFALSTEGVARSLERARAEARKCVLLCANCHAEVEAGLATIPP